MKALRFHEYGGRDKLVVESVPDPVAGPGEVVVKVGACALNHLDVDFREGISRFPLELPLIMGLELAGTIVSRGPGVSEQWKVGDRVAPYLMGTDPDHLMSRTGRENLSPAVHRRVHPRRLRGVRGDPRAPPRAHARLDDRRRGRGLPDRLRHLVPHALHAR